MYEGVKKGLEKTLRAAVGQGRDEDEYKSLPADPDDTFETNIAKFFNGGQWLVEIDEANIPQNIEETARNLERRIAHEIIKSNGWALLLDTNKDSADDCGDRTGRQWIEFDNEWYCAKLSRKNDRWSDYEEADDEFHEKLDKYGLGNREPYYKAVVDCAMNGGDGRKMDVTDIHSGEVPRCFFEMKTIKVVGKTYCGKNFECNSNLEEV